MGLRLCRLKNINSCPHLFTGFQETVVWAQGIPAPQHCLNHFRVSLNVSVIIRAKGTTTITTNGLNPEKEGECAWGGDRKARKNGGEEWVKEPKVYQNGRRKLEQRSRPENGN